MIEKALDSAKTDQKDQGAHMVEFMHSRANKTMNMGKDSKSYQK